MALQKREKKCEGTTFLFYGLSASGKSPTALSFPDQLLFDSDRGTKFYTQFDQNVIMESNTLNFKEMNDDLDEFEEDEELFAQVQTINVDSITRYYENMQHAYLKLAEKRAIKAGRSADSEGLAVKDWGSMGLRYASFFSRILTYASQGKNIVFVAEQTDMKENRQLADGTTSSVTVGIKPNTPKDTKFDFDVVVNTFEKDGVCFGKVEKDRTGTFKIGEVIEMPHHSMWEAAIKLALTGRKRNKDEIKTFEDNMESEASGIQEDSGEIVLEIKDEITAIINKLSAEKQKELVAAFTTKIGDAKYKSTKDVTGLRKYLEVAKSIK